MKKEKRKVDAVSILHRRYIGDDAERKASLREERVNDKAARMIFELQGLKAVEMDKIWRRSGLGCSPP